MISIQISLEKCLWLVESYEIRPEKSYNLIVGPEKSWKLKLLRLVD